MSLGSSDPSTWIPRNIRACKYATPALSLKARLPVEAAEDILDPDEQWVMDETDAGSGEQDAGSNGQDAGGAVKGYGYIESR